MQSSVTSKAVLATVLLAALATGACSRRDTASDQTASARAGSTDTTTASRAGTAADSGTSSGSSGTSGSVASSGSSDSSGTSGGSSTPTSRTEDATAKAGDKMHGAASKTGEVVDDSVITTKIKSAMLADTTIKGTDVSVDTRKGEVTLTGTVKNQQQLDKIQKMASSTEGVKGVHNKVTVK